MQKITALKFLQVQLKFKQLITVGRRKILTLFYECSVPGLFALITSYVFNRGDVLFFKHKNCLPESRFTDHPQPPACAIFPLFRGPGKAEINAVALKVL